VYEGTPGDCVASAEEIGYLCRAVNRYFTREIAAADVVWHYSGVRPLVDDGTQNASQITRDYTLHVEGDATRAPILCVFGGKITTYRRLAEHALEKLEAWFPGMRAAWTAGAPLPGGDLNGQDPEQFADGLAARYPALQRALLLALAKRHGSLVPQVLGDAATPTDLGRHFGHTLYAREVDYFLRHEWAHTAEDVMWRRTKCGLHMNLQQKHELVDYVTMAAARSEG
jgi:glycerol-3-phosphate dehydrogenase